ncbi:putative germin-like protein 2-1 isoform X1 [Amborella trichopoda]|uniref:putative germin-like protein 2-1 isoform X1 n=1 Tax=Amborella trichopoda TaxID=13333 RepID=UPI0009BF9EF3|nr:putative germin-like protein 2-1 isoform X1 [Amborella trichopoda]|eukprot:XP_020524320.1 putative germin-like protein 2-1 isoform X1 [Amborella trichopoda]
MTMKSIPLLLSLLALIASPALASDPSPLQDFCITDQSGQGVPLNAVFANNGKVCKDPKLAQANDFFFSGLDKPGNTTNALGSKVTPVNVAQLAGLSTLGISMVRIDYAPGGQNPPHTHPRATEILTVLEGSLYVGFVTSNPDNRLISKTLQKGDVFVFPQGLIHFQQNVGYKNAVAIAALSSENPGVITISNTVFGSKPAISTDVLAKAFQVDKMVVNQIQSQF